MDSIVVPIYFDYASTLCYIAWRIIGELRLELDFEPFWKGVPIRWRSHSSRPGNALGPIEWAKIAGVITETGVQVVPPGRWIDSDAALMGSELAREACVFDAFHDLAFRHAFELRRDISHLDCLSEIAAAAGMQVDNFQDAIQRRLTMAQLRANKSEADQFCAIGYPSFVLGEFPLIGIQPKETMRLLLSRFITQRRSESQA